MRNSNKMDKTCIPERPRKGFDLFYSSTRAYSGFRNPPPISKKIVKETIKAFRKLMIEERT